MNYSEYISQSLAKGTIGSSISVGIFALIGVFALLGLYSGLTRGFSKSVIRFFTVILSALGAIISVAAICNLVVNLTNASGTKSVDEVINTYLPGVLDSVPAAVEAILSEMGTETATIFVMMLVCITITPVLFLTFFYLLRILTFPVYKLLSGLIGAVDYRKGIPSVIFGGLIGLLQGIIIAGVILTPIGGLCGAIESARKPLIKDNAAPNEMIVYAYEQIFDDLTDNPVFDTINGFGGKAAYDAMVNVTVSGNKINMVNEAIGLVEIGAEGIPLLDTGFNWLDPTSEQKDAMVGVVEGIGNNSLISSLASDVMRGIAACIDSGAIDVPLEGTNKTLIEDVLRIFHTSTKDNIGEDLDMIVDIYLIMCDHRLLVTFNEGDTEAMRELLTDKNENGDTVIDVILNRLNESERGKPITRSFTKISLSLMQGNNGTISTELYETVKGDIQNVLSHNKSDYASDEEYRAAIESDLDQAFEDNGLNVSDDVKQNMLDYIEKNYSDTSEITDDDIDDAILSYYSSYSSAKEEREENADE